MVVAACRGESRQAPRDARRGDTVVPADAVDDAALEAVTSAVKVQLDCTHLGPKEKITVRTDPATQIGTLHLLTAAGSAPQRKIRYRAVPAGDGYDLVFDAYLPGDYVSLAGTPYRDAPPRETLTPGRSVLAHLGVRADTRVMYVDRDLDLGRGMIRSPELGAYRCR